jgi:hypothetical protein
MIRKRLAALILTAGLGLVGGCTGLSLGNGSGCNGSVCNGGGLFSHFHGRNGASTVAGAPCCPTCPTGCGFEGGCCEGGDSFLVPEAAYGVPAMPGLGAAPCPGCGVNPVSPYGVNPVPPYGVKPPSAIPGMPPTGVPTTPPPLMPQLTEPPIGNGGSTKYSFTPQAMPVPYYPGTH